MTKDNKEEKQPLIIIRENEKPNLRRRRTQSLDMLPAEDAPAPKTEDLSDETPLPAPQTSFQPVKKNLSRICQKLNLPLLLFREIKRRMR